MPRFLRMSKRGRNPCHCQVGGRLGFGDYLLLLVGVRLNPRSFFNFGVLTFLQKPQRPEKNGKGHSCAGFVVAFLTLRGAEPDLLIIDCGRRLDPDTKVPGFAHPPTFLGIRDDTLDERSLGDDDAIVDQHILIDLETQGIALDSGFAGNLFSSDDRDLGSIGDCYFWSLGRGGLLSEGGGWKHGW